ncbi:MAG: hypothetical protein HQM15_07965 [Deltaproteobacteria bacterium]|nr:hypothetical protein [Deltaproteobacteria bacterium]
MWKSKLFKQVESYFARVASLQLNEAMWNEQVENYALFCLLQKSKRLEQYPLENDLAAADEILNMFGPLRPEYVAWLQQEYPALKLKGDLSGSNLAKALVRMLQAADQDKTIRERFDCRVKKLREKYRFETERAIAIAYLESREEVLSKIPRPEKKYDNAGAIFRVLVYPDLMPMPLERLVKLTLNRSEFREIMQTFYMQFWKKIIEQEHSDDKAKQNKLEIAAYRVFEAFLKPADRYVTDDGSDNGFRLALEHIWQRRIQEAFHGTIQQRIRTYESLKKLCSSARRTELQSFPELRPLNFMEDCLIRPFLKDLKIEYQPDLQSSVYYPDSLVIVYLVQIVANPEVSEAVQNLIEELLFEPGLQAGKKIKAGVFERYKARREELRGLLGAGL